MPRWILTPSSPRQRPTVSSPATSPSRCSPRVITLTTSSAPTPTAAPVRRFRVTAQGFTCAVLRNALAAAGGSVAEGGARLLHLPISTFRYQAVKLDLLPRPKPRRAIRGRPEKPGAGVGAFLDAVLQDSDRR